MADRLTSPELAEKLGVRRQMVDKYRERGMPAKKKRVRGGDAYTFDLEECKAWLAENKVGRGGKKAPEVPPVPPPIEIDVEGLGYEEIIRRSTVMAGRGMTPVDATKAHTGLKAADALIDIEVKLGNLLKREDVTSAWGRCLAVLKTNIEGIPGRFTPLLLGALKLGPEHEAAVRGVLAQAVRDLLRDLARDPLGEGNV